MHGDVFRPASHATFFSALIGSGYHLTVVTLGVILLTITGELYTEYAALLQSLSAMFLIPSILLGVAHW